MRRSLEKTYESIARTSPDIAETLGKARVVKIEPDSTSFGKLHHLIPMDSGWFRAFLEVLEGLGERDLMLFRGFSLLPTETFTTGAFTCSSTCSTMWFWGIEKIEDVGFEEFYKIGVTQSIVMDVRPGFSRFKIDRNGRLVEV